jgi:hypothetical protein
VAGFGSTGTEEDIVTLRAGVIPIEDCKDAPDEYFCTGIKSEHFKDYGIYIYYYYYLKANKHSCWELNV